MTCSHHRHQHRPTTPTLSQGQMKTSTSKFQTITYTVESLYYDGGLMRISCPTCVDFSSSYGWQPLSCLCALYRAQKAGSRALTRGRGFLHHLRGGVIGVTDLTAMSGTSRIFLVSQVTFISSFVYRLSCKRDSTKSKGRKKQA